MGMKFGLKPKATNKPIANKEQEEKKATRNIFSPSEEQRNFKARWWVSYNSNEIQAAPIELTKLEIKSIYDHPALDIWMTDDDFKRYLFNANEVTERLECLFGLALDEAEEILRTRDPKYLPYKTTMIKLIAELADKMPRKDSSPKFADALIASMTKDQLKEYVEKNKKLIGKGLPDEK